MSNPEIPAATILLLRDEPAFEVLMIERHKDVPFAGGAVAFPGGRLDPSDADAAWADLCDGGADLAADECAARIGAIREAFEETGVLYARDASGAFIGDERTLAIDGERAGVEADAGGFLELVRRENVRLALDALHYFARWAPPKNAEHRRYNTWFFAATMPPAQTAREDGNEATESVWIAPGEVLAARERGERKMIFPTARNVELLNLSNSANAVFSFAAERKIELVRPTVVDRNGELFVTIPDGLGYPVTEEPVATAFRS